MRTTPSVPRSKSGYTFKAIDTDIPDSRGAELRAARHAANLSLSQGARVLVMRVDDVWALEVGEKTFLDPQDWTRAMHILRTYAAKYGKEGAA